MFCLMYIYNLTKGIVSMGRVALTYMKITYVENM